MYLQQEAPFLFVGKHLVLDFVNTEIVQRRIRVDLWANWQAALDWFVAAQVITNAEAEALRHTPEAETALRQLRGFRAILREMCASLVRGEENFDPFVQELNRVTSQSNGYSEIVFVGTKWTRRICFTPQNVTHLLLPIAEAAGELLCYANRGYVKRCHNPACTHFFYDTTKNHTRRWCSMSACGNRIKAASHYRRKRQDEAVPPAH